MKLVSLARLLRGRTVDLLKIDIDLPREEQVCKFYLLLVLLTPYSDVVLLCLLPLTLPPTPSSFRRL